jgi:hypothetical protein
MTKLREQVASKQPANRVEAPGIDLDWTEAWRSPGKAMSGGWSKPKACSEVEAPGIEPGSENDLLAHLRT